MNEIDTKAAAEFAAQAGIGNAISNGPLTQMGGADPAWLKFERERTDRQAAEMATGTRLNIFAEILRARPEVDAQTAADEAVKVYEKLK